MYLLPNSARLCWAERTEKKIDGVNIASLMMGEDDAEPRSEFVYYYQKNSLEAVRKGSWKLIFPHKYRTYLQDIPGSDGYPGKVRKVPTGQELYNLSSDTGETVDVQEAFPRSDESRVGKACVGTCRSRWWTYNKKKKK